MKRIRCLLAAACLLGSVFSASGADMELASDTNAALHPMGLRVQFDAASSPKDVSQSIRILLLLTALSLAPSALIMTTSFTRILIVLGFLRHALGTQQTPPAQVITGMALFLTIFVMSPVWKKINTDAIQPYMAEQITQQEAWTKGVAPLRAFMEKQVGSSELSLFVELTSKGKTDKEKADDKDKEVALEALVPAFMISELKTAFQLGFLIYLPFLVIDLVIASSLMSLGMMMLPPMMVSLPMKLLFFVLADGWTLMIRGVVSSFSL